MDFTFDNPFDDVFTDPNALATQPPAVAVAPVAVQPVQPVQPVQNPVAPVQNYQMPPTAVAPAVYTPQTIANPALTTPSPQTTPPVAQNPAIPTQQLYTAPPTVQNPVFTQPATTTAVVAPNTFQQNPAIATQIPVTQQPFNPGLPAGVPVQQPLQTPQTAPVVSNPVQTPVQQTPQTTETAATVVAQQPAATAPPTADATNPNDIWREAKAPNGRIYYYKKSTRETTWTKPATYIPLGGTVPISSAGGAAPAATPVTPVAATPVGVAPATNTPLTGFNLSALGSTPTGATPLSASGANDNPGLMGGATPVQNPALVNPALGMAGPVNPALGTNNGNALVASNPSLSNSSSSLGNSNPSLGAPSNPSLFVQSGSTTPAQTAGLANSNPALLNPALGGTNAGATGGFVQSGSNPALLGTNPALMGVNPALGVTESGSQQNLAVGTGYGVNVGQTATGNGLDQSGSSVGVQQPGQQLPYGQGVEGVQAVQAPQMQQVQQVMYDANGQVMYDANGQVMYTIVEVPIDPSQQQAYDPNHQQGQQQFGFNNGQQQSTDPNQFNNGQYDPNTGMMVNGQYNPNNGMMANNGMVAGQGAPVAAATSSAPSTPSFPKTFKVRLPADQRQVVPFKADQTLRQVLSKICGARGLSMDDYLPKDRSGMDISLDKTLGEINQEEISFLTPRAGVVPQDETKRKAHKLLSDIYEANAGLSSSLQAIIKNYRDPLLKSAQDVDMRKRLLTEQECNQIFASIESITSMTKDFMSHLSAQLSTWPVDLTEMVTRHAEVLTFYNEFVNNYRANMNKLEDLRRNPDFAAFVDGVQRALGSKLRLEDFMALPAVKIAATSTLIEQLIAVLTDQHPNFFMLRDFHQRLQPIANQATSLRLQMEARSKIVTLEATIAKFPKKASFLHDQRIFFRDGVFELGTKKKPALCYVALFTDLMIVCKAPEKKKKDKPATPPTFEEVIAFGPTSCTVEEVGSQGWNLHIDAGKGKFTVNCSIHTSSEYSKADWVKSFKDAFHDFSGKPHLKPPVL